MEDQAFWEGIHIGPGPGRPGRPLAGGKCHVLAAWLLVLGCLVGVVGCQQSTRPTSRPSSVAPAIRETKPVSFAILEDYDKGQDLNYIAQDFAMMRELGIRTLRCSFSWVQLEPERGQYDFVWLKQFVTLANEYGIVIRPYIDYTPRWAGRPGKDTEDWNNPPANLGDWYNFVYQLVATLRPYPNVVSYEVYNEENAPFWWDGTVGQYELTLVTAEKAIHDANPDVQVLLGGFVFADMNWLGPIVTDGYWSFYDVTSFHAYPETWSPANVNVENWLGDQYRARFVPLNNVGGPKPIWVNEMGFATTPGKTQEQQANWFARAVSTFLAEPEIQEIGVFELRDNPPERTVLGGNENYYLGITDQHRDPKLAFYTVKMLSRLLSGVVTTADEDATVKVVSGRPGELYYHLFQRPEGTQILFVYDKTAGPTVEIKLKEVGQQAFVYDLKGMARPYEKFDGDTIAGLKLEPGEVRVIEVDP